MNNLLVTRSFAIIVPLLLLSIVILAFIDFSGDAEVTLIVRTNEITEDDTVFIAGNIPELGRWNPADVPLIRENDSLWTYSFKIPPETPLEFKLTLGGWDRERLDASGAAPPNYYLTPSGDTTVTISAVRWKVPGEELPGFEGGVTGSVEFIDTLQHPMFGGRTVNVWLPPGYEEDTGKRYPVLYMLDGQNLFDPSTSSFGVDWQIDETADSLITKGQIEPVIIAGVYNGPARTAEYTRGDTMTAFMEFIVTTVKPAVDNLYRTKPGREYTAIGGSSAGGTIAFSLLWNYPQVFSKAACLSPAFKIRHIDLTEVVANSPLPDEDFLLYIDNGGLGLDEALQAGVDEMLAALKKAGATDNANLLYSVDSTAGHNEAAWAERIHQPLIFFFCK